MQQQRPVAGPHPQPLPLALGPNRRELVAQRIPDPANGTLLRNLFPKPGLGMSGPGPLAQIARSILVKALVTCKRLAPISSRVILDGSILSYPTASPANDIVFTGGAPNYEILVSSGNSAHRAANSCGTWIWASKTVGNQNN